MLVDSRGFMIRHSEVEVFMRKYGFLGVSEVIRFLFPDVIFYKETRSHSGYWGKLPYPRRVRRGVSNCGSSADR